MARSTYTEKVGYYWAPSIADPAAPTSAEMTAATDLSCEIAEYPDLSVSISTVEAPSLCDRFTASYPDTETVDDTTIVFYADDDPRRTGEQQPTPPTARNAHTTAKKLRGALAGTTRVTVTVEAVRSSVLERIQYAHPPAQQQIANAEGRLRVHPSRRCRRPLRTRVPATATGRPATRCRPIRRDGSRVGRRSTPHPCTRPDRSRGRSRRRRTSGRRGG